MQHSSLVIISFSLLLIFCTPQKIDYPALNTLLADHKYEQAILRIEQYRQSTDNPLDIQKLDQLYVRADKALLFKDVQLKIQTGDTNQVARELHAILQEIKSKDSLAQRWYYFDYYMSKGNYYHLKKDSANQMQQYLKAIEFPVTDLQKKITVCFDLAFHYAELRQFDTAREWLDKALRSFDKNAHKNGLLDVYMAYMNGDFIKADSLLDDVPEQNKNLNWQRVESFFNLYADSLSLNNRFRLW